MPTLFDLKEGDPVIVQVFNYTHEDSLYLEKVERTTNTQVLVLGVRYRKRDGKQINGALHPNYIYVPTPELEHQAKCQRLKALMLRKLAAVRWADLESEHLIEVCK